MEYLVILFLGYLLATRFDIKIYIDNTQTKSGENGRSFPHLPTPKLVVLLIIVLAFLAPETLPNVINIIHQLPPQ